MLVLPKKARNLIPDKYQKLINTKLKHIYKEEDCKCCNEYIKKINLYHELISKNKSQITYKDKIKFVSLNFQVHKREHKNDFTIKDIKEVANII